MANKNQSNGTPIQRIAVGMSGGTDSSAATALLVDQGFEVIGLTAHMWKTGSRCCSLEDVERARKVCAYLGIRHYVVNAQDLFTEKVVNPFVQEYASGRTPSPCIQCNAFIKFGFLLERALQLDCSHLAMGHYARVEKWSDEKYHLLAAKDASKDQSYFLHRLNQRQLAHLLFPLSDMPKTEVKAYSKKRGLPIVPRGESQDLCFVEEGKLPEFLEEREPALRREGKICTPDGKEVGTHQGIHRFTLGQRGKLGIALGERVYVSQIDPSENRIEVSPREGVMQTSCILTHLHWISGEAPASKLRCQVRPRYRAPAAPATLEIDSKTHSAKLLFDEPQFAPAPGQAAVFYKEGEVLGGGWIARANGTYAQTNPRKEAT
jgi:tRNA-specific 2-thiouridylase